MSFRLFESASHARVYAKFRPSYPPAIGDKLFGIVSARLGGSSWKGVDVACGSGQSTSVLQRAKFSKIYALDISEEQVGAIFKCAENFI